MPGVFAKLNYKDQAQMVVVDSPASFEPELAALKGVEILRDFKKTSRFSFFLAFVTTQKQVDALGAGIGKKADGDAVVWLAYPKGSSKRYKSEISRDHGWDVLGRAGYEPVRMVAIDEDWSALRFRKAEFIKNMSRAKEHRLTERSKDK